MLTLSLFTSSSTLLGLNTCALTSAEQGRLHAARGLASGLSQFINTTAVTLTHHGTIQVELQDACKAAFNRYAPCT